MDTTGETQGLQVEEHKANPEEARNLFLNRSVECYLEQGLPIPEKAPEFVHHNFQVETVGVNFIRESNLSEEEKKIAEAQTREHTQDHDLGRAEGKIGANPNHPEDGYRRLKSQGMSEKRAAMCLDHDQWGIGKSIEGRPNNLELAKKDPKALIEKYEKMYGIAGLVTIVADLSKDYSDPENIHMPTIAPLTRELAERLIKRQLDTGRFKEGEERHQSEMVGINFMFVAIKHLEEKYGINYNKAVAKAKEEWEKVERPAMEALWVKERAKVQAKAIIFPTKAPTEEKIAA